MLRRVALVKTDVSEDLSASIIRVTRIGELGTLAVTSNRRTLRRNKKVASYSPTVLILNQTNTVNTTHTVSVRSILMLSIQLRLIFLVVSFPLASYQ
jgi:hypothetical protein